MTFRYDKEYDIVRPINDIPKENIIRSVPRSKSQEQDKNLTSSNIPDALAWSGCLAFPQYCPIISGVNKAYRIYNKNLIDNQNEEHENILKEIAKIISTNASIKVTTNQIESSSDSIVKSLDNSGLLDLITKETNISKNTVDDIIRSTTSNFIKNGLGNATDVIFKNIM